MVIHKDKSVFWGIWAHLSNKRRIQILLLLIVIIISGFAELVSLGAVVPFLSVLNNQDDLFNNSFVQEILSYFSINSSSELILPVTILFILSVSFSGLIRLLSVWMSSRITASIGTDLSCQSFERSLYQPFQVHTQNNSSSLISGIINHVRESVVAIRAFLMLISSVVIVGSLTIGLFLINWKIACGSILIFGSVYYLIGYFARQRLRQNSRSIAVYATQQIKVLQEGLGAIRDLILDNNQDIYVDLYRKSDLPQRRLIAQNQFLGLFPRYAVEMLGLIFIALIAVLSISSSTSSGSLVPVLGSLALGAQKLLPALQQIYNNWSILKANSDDLRRVLYLLNQQIETVNTFSEMTFQKSITFDCVSFQYDESLDVLKGLNFKISRGECIGLVGTTGSGKSTLVDILMGLLSPTSGRILVDNLNLFEAPNTSNLSAWRSKISHVPQTIFLSDSSISENIAFGVCTKDIDIDKVKYVAGLAQISDFIESLPHGYSSNIGERGVRLSGGQRQRLGIARALYGDSEILVLDEATSALDQQTENLVMDAVNNLSRQMTIIMIAHRLSTLQRCDRIIKIENGALIKIGSPSEVL